MILMLIICLVWLLLMTKNNIIRAAIILFFLVWQGLPAYNKWQADKLVDELCAKDGGIKVYETVTLPKERFNQWGQFVVPGKRVMKPNDEYYTVWEITNIRGRHESSDIGALSITKSHFLLYRSKDKKLLGESIGYGRRGGDAIGPWHPSSYLCPRDIDNELSKQIFMMSDK